MYLEGTLYVILNKNIEKVFLQCRIIAWVCQMKVYNTSMNSTMDEFHPWEWTKSMTSI
jgi:hypothetical protein